MKIPAVILCKLQREHAAKVIPKFSHYWSSLNKINQKLYIIWRLFLLHSQSWFRDGTFWDRDFLFWERSKNPENFEIPGTFGIFSEFYKNPRNFWQIPRIRDFLSLGILFPGIRDFLESRDFYPRDSGFFWVSGFKSPGIRNFLNFGIFIPGIGIFFVGWDIPKKANSVQAMILFRNLKYFQTLWVYLISSSDSRSTV